MPSPTTATVGRIAAITAMAALALTGCTPAAEPEPTVSTSPSAAPTQEPTSSPTPEATGEAETAIEACEPISLDLGAELAGADLGACLQASVAALDTGVVELLSPELAGHVEYRYDPSFAFAAELETGDGAVAMSYVDGVMLLDDGTGPVVGDLESEDEAEQMAGMTGELYRVFADPGFVGDLIREGELLNVASTLESVELADGTSVPAYRIDSAAAYTWYDIPVDALTVWVTEDWTPVAAESTTAFLGRTSTIRQEFSGLGEPVTIRPLG